MKSKNTKRALLTSVLSMLLCVAMLVGSTFAWFTDSVTSGKNKIVAGNLDVELYHTNGAVADEKIGADTKLFVNDDGSDILWEPGVMVYENLTVKNVGSLALKYNLAINVDSFNTVAGTEKSLKDVLKVAILDEAFSGDRTAAQALTFDKTIADFAKEGNIAAQAADDTYAIVIYWEPSDVDNDYNLNNGKTSSDGKPLYVDLGISLVATQDTVENDSFDNQYDAEAGFPVLSQQALQSAIDNAQPGDTVIVGNINAVEPIVVGKDITLKGVDGSALKDAVVQINNNASVVIENIDFTGDSYIHNQGMSALTMKGCDVDVNVPVNANNGRASFISLGNRETADGVILDIQNNSFKVKSTVDNYAAAIFGWSYIADGSVISGNTFGSEDSRYTFIAVKLMNFVDGATVTINDNTVYGTVDSFYFYAFDLYQNNSRANQYTANFSGNNVNVAGTKNPGHFLVLEADNRGSQSATVNIDATNTYNGNAVTIAECDVEDTTAGTVNIVDSIIPDPGNPDEGDNEDPFA